MASGSLPSNLMSMLSAELYVGHRYWIAGPGVESVLVDSSVSECKSDERRWMPNVFSYSRMGMGGQLSPPLRIINKRHAGGRDIEVTRADMT